MQEDTTHTPADSEVDNQLSNKLKGLTVLGRVELPITPRPSRGPRPVTKYKEPTHETGSFTSEGTADAMTREFARDMSGSRGYDDNLDMDQQSQEYWDNI